MPGRSRTMSSSSALIGRKKIVSSYTTKASYPGVKVRCDDFVGNPKGMNALMINREEVGSIEAINGVWDSLTSFDNCPPTWSISGGMPPVIVVPGSYRDPTDAIGRSHPGEPAIKLPVFLFELKDVPDMLKHARDRAADLAKAAGARRAPDVLRYLKKPKNPAKDWLNYNFGWRPFFSDLASFSGVADWMHSRSKIMKRISHSPYSKRAGLGQNTRTTVENLAYPVETLTTTAWLATGITSYSTTRWCVSRWQSDPFMFDAALSDDGPYLLRKALGLDDLTGLWDAIPWSWLTDWFINCDSVLSAYSNRMGIRFKDACVCEHNISHRTFHPKPQPRVSGGGGYLVHETKSRAQASPSILPSGLNYLGASQLATLASLKVTRAK